MTKRLWAGIFGAVMLLGVLPTAALVTDGEDWEMPTAAYTVCGEAQSERSYTVQPVAAGTCGKDALWVLDADGTLTISGTGLAQRNSGMNNAADSVKSVVIEEGITGLGGSIFKEFANMAAVKLPDTLTQIGEYAFFGCESLGEVIIPDGVTEIAGWTFKHCTSLTSVVLPDGLTRIGQTAFGVCSGLTEVVFPKTITSIGDWAFSQCSALNTLKLPEGITDIGCYAFRECDGLTAITIPASAVNIGEYAFQYCDNLKVVTIAENTTYIGEKVFYECYGLQKVILPDSLVEIGKSAFHGCSSLTSVVLPKQLKTIGAGAFMKCSALTSITIPESVTLIGADAFCHCSNIGSIYFRGDAPILSHDCFELVFGRIYYPKCNSTWTQSIMQSYGGLLFWRSYTPSGTGHKFGAWTQTAPPDCTQKGAEKRICHCGHSEARDIAALGHSWDKGTVIQTPTDHENGLKRFLCTHCGEFQDEVLAREEIPVTITRSGGQICISARTDFADYTGSGLAVCSFYDRQGRLIKTELKDGPQITLTVGVPDGSEVCRVFLLTDGYIPLCRSIFLELT